MGGLNKSKEMVSGVGEEDNDSAYNIDFDQMVGGLVQDAKVVWPLDRPRPKLDPDAASTTKTPPKARPKPASVSSATTVSKAKPVSSNPASISSTWRSVAAPPQPPVAEPPKTQTVVKVQQKDKLEISFDSTAKELGELYRNLEKNLPIREKDYNKLPKKTADKIVADTKQAKKVLVKLEQLSKDLASHPKAQAYQHRYENLKQKEWINKGNKVKSSAEVGSSQSKPIPQEALQQPDEKASPLWTHSQSGPKVRSVPQNWGRKSLNRRRKHHGAKRPEEEAQIDRFADDKKQFEEIIRIIESNVELIHFGFEMFFGALADDTRKDEVAARREDLIDVQQDVIDQRAKLEKIVKTVKDEKMQKALQSIQKITDLIAKFHIKFDKSKNTVLSIDGAEGCLEAVKLMREFRQKADLALQLPSSPADTKTTVASSSSPTVQSSAAPKTTSSVTAVSATPLSTAAGQVGLFPAISSEERIKVQEEKLASNISAKKKQFEQATIEIINDLKGLIKDINNITAALDKISSPDPAVLLPERLVAKSTLLPLEKEIVRQKEMILIKAGKWWQLAQEIPDDQEVQRSYQINLPRFNMILSWGIQKELVRTERVSKEWHYTVLNQDLFYPGVKILDNQTINVTGADREKIIEDYVVKQNQRSAAPK